MPISQVLFSMAALGVSALCGGKFLGARSRTILCSALAAAVAGELILALVPAWLPGLSLSCLGLLPAAALLWRMDRRPISDGVLTCLVGCCYFGLWITFYRGLVALGQVGIVLWLYCAFFLLHLPALLLTFPGFSLPRDWQVRLRSRQTPWLGIPLLVGVAGLLGVLMLLVLPLLPADTSTAVWAKLLVAMSLFWAGLTLLVLLATYGQNRVQNSAEQDYRQDMTTFLNVVRSQRHDYNLHVQTVAGLIAQQKWEECRSYVNALVQDTSELNAILPIKDPAVAALIGHFRALAAQQGIALEVDIRDDLTRIATNTYETNKILGNLLQNALDELERQPELPRRRIDLDIFKRGEYCLIRVSNQVPDPEAFARRQETIFHQGYTTKQGHDGVGLSSIQALARQAGGDVSVWLEQNTAHFIASIPMNYVSQPEEGLN